LLEAGTVTDTAAEANSGACRLSSADLGISNMTYSCPPFWIGEGVAIVGHKLANKTGLNNYIRRFTMGFASL
jgi:hypothetical protein